MNGQKILRILITGASSGIGEAIALEMKNSLDRNMVITVSVSQTYKEEIWDYMLSSIYLYITEASYYERYVEGQNLLTGYVGNTYGWVKVNE